MNQWTPENISALIVAITGVITAVGAVIHSKNTRQGIVEHEEEMHNANQSDPGTKASG
jgi:cell division protein FtsL